MDLEIKNFSKNQKLKFCLKIVEKVKKDIVNEEAFSMIEKAETISHLWMNEHVDISIELYDYIDGEDSGFTVFQEFEEDKKQIAAWNCIIDAFAYICKEVFIEKGEKYFPEPIELVDERTLIHLINSFIICMGDDKELNNILYECVK